MITEIVNYFENIPSSHRSIMLFGGIALFWIIENGIPLFKFKYNKFQHAFVNLFFTFIVLFIKNSNET